MYLDEAVVEVEAEQAGGEADVLADGVPDEVAHDGLGHGAAPLVEVEGQAARDRRLPQPQVVPTGAGGLLLCRRISPRHQRAGHCQRRY